MRKLTHNYPKERKSAPMSRCPLCGKIIKSRGVHAHMRLQHPFEIAGVKKENHSGNVGQDNLSKKPIAQEKPKEKTLEEIDRETMVMQFGEENVKKFDEKMAKEKEQHKTLGKWFGLYFPDE
jgi:hypothetical protein